MKGSSADPQRRAVSRVEAVPPALGRVAMFGILAATAVVSLTFGAVFVLIADLQDRIGFPDWGLGAVMSSSFLASFGAQVSLARYADRGHARLMLGAGIALAVVGMAGFAAGGSLALLVGARALMGFGDGIFLPAARRIVASAAPGREAEALGRLSSAELGGFIAGPPLAALAAGMVGLRAPFLLFAGLVVVCGPMLALVDEPVGEPEIRPSGVFGVLLRTPGVRAGLAIGAGLYLTVGAFDGLWSRFLGDLGASTGLVAVSLLLFGLPMVVAMPSGGRLADRVGPQRAGFAALVCGLPLIVAYGRTRLLWLLIVIAVVHAIVDSVTMPSGLAAVARATPPGLLGAGQGLYGAVGAVAGAVGSAGVAPLYGAAGPGWAWLATALAVAGIVVAGLLLGVRRSDRSAPDDLRPERRLRLDAALAV